MVIDKTPAIERTSQHVQILFEGQCLADTNRSVLLIESYAPDIYIPFEDIDMSCMEKTESKTHCSNKGDASFWTIRVGEMLAKDAMWAYEFPHLSCSGIAGHAAFKFNLVETFVDEQRVRGHVRDPNKIISTENMETHLQMELGGEIVVDSNSWVMLYETGLPARHYVPIADVKAEFLVPSVRQTVCTYKGEASYHNIQVVDRLLENRVWCYSDPWLDFSKEVQQISGLYGLYSSAFDRVLVDGRLVESDEAASRTDAAMQAAPTIDATLAARLNEQ